MNRKDITDLRTAAQHALKALDTLYEHGKWGDFDGVADVLRAALEVDDGMYGAKALAQAYENGWNAAKAEPVQEPDHCAALVEHYCDTYCTWADHAPGCVRTEPVAWQWLDTGHFRKKIPRQSNPAFWRPLYATPVNPIKEVNLDCCPKCGGPADNGHDREFPPNPYYCTKCSKET